MKQKKRGLITAGLVDIGEATLAAVVPVEVVGHEGSGAALGVGALLAKPLDLSRLIHPVVLQDGELHLLVLVLQLLRLGVRLLLPLLRAAAEAEDEVERGLLLDVCNS